MRKSMLTGLSLLVAGMTFIASPAGATYEPVVSDGPSDADSIALLAGSLYVNSKMAGGLPFWWDHTNLTVAVQSARTTDAEDVEAARDAIALWSEVLQERLPDISLTDITASNRNANRADIVVHLVPYAGGMAWGGSAVCGSQKCLNVLVKSDMPPGHLDTGELDIADFDPLRVERETLHELGHALGLGHASPLEKSIDIMGYGWAYFDPDVTPILSDCDLAGIRIAFGWFFDHEPPHASVVSAVQCEGG